MLYLIVFLIFFLFSSQTFASFELQGVDIVINIDENGRAFVEEKINIIVKGEYAKQLYENSYYKNTLAHWQDVTQIDEIRTHINSHICDIKNLIVRPQPLRASMIDNNLWFGQIIINYEALPYFTPDGNIVNNTGIIKVEKYKPRVKRYFVRESAFNFDRTVTGDIKLERSQTLTLILPENSKIIFLNPLPLNYQSSKPVEKRELKWSGVTLIQFSVIYEIEESLHSEVITFFEEQQKLLKAQVFSSEGIAFLILVGTILFSFVYLKIEKEKKR